MTTGPTTIDANAKGVTAQSSRGQKAKQDVWSTVVWNDSVNLPTYISHVLAQQFGFDLDHARTIADRVNAEGSAVVATGLRERVEADVQALHGFGIRATMEPADA